MARYLGPVCKLCRREGLKLFLKGERCYTEKCAVTRRAYPPGQHGQGRVKLSEYAVRLREKQKVRRIYGLVEKQFRKYYVTAAGSTGRTGEVMLGLLERRLDNLVYRGGFASTRSEARQLVRHKHILVNGKLVNVPSYLVQVGDVVSVRESSAKLGVVVTSLANSEKRPTLSWLGVEKGEFSLKLNADTVRDELNEPAIREQYVVEYYSR